MRQVLRGFVSLVRPVIFRYDPVRRASLHTLGLFSPHYRKNLTREAIADRIGLLRGGRILHGPFAGLRYVRHESTYNLPMLVGSYEAELHPVIDDLVRSAPYDLVIDIGCAGGYYAVGLAERLGGARVLAFDIDADMRHLCRTAARLNGVADRVEVKGRCDEHELAAVSASRVLLFIDAEGYEADIVDPELVPQLSRWDMIVEYHEEERPGVADLLRRRFAHTHEITSILPVKRSVEDFPAIAGLAPAEQEMAVAENRERVGWLVMRPRDNKGTPAT
jgi:hypothetical protein